MRILVNKVLHRYHNFSMLKTVFPGNDSFENFFNAIIIINVSMYLLSARNFNKTRMLQIFAVCEFCAIYVDFNKTRPSSSIYLKPYLRSALA